MKKTNGKIVLILLCVTLIVLSLCACSTTSTGTGSVSTDSVENTAEENSSSDQDNDGTGDTLDAETVVNDAAEQLEETQQEVDDSNPEGEPVAEAYQSEPEEKVVDLIIFGGQSNMSGCGGDASLAPAVVEGAGFEFRAVSDPTKLYTIVEPFGINENNLNGLCEKPTGKKGSLVSAFVNEYYKQTGVPVVAVSASKGEMSMSQFLEPGVVNDVTNRFIGAKIWLLGSGYTVRNMYMVWLQGESDGIKKTQPDVYRTQMDDFIRPLFMEGLQKVFFITPGRTIPELDIYLDIINAQKDMCRDSGYYSLASTILSGVSTEYMTDIYHYNQHVLNLVGEDAADAVAYYANNNQPKVIYDYRRKNEYVPVGQEFQERDPNMKKDLENININETY